MKRKKRKLKIGRIIFLFVVLIGIIFGICYGFKFINTSKNEYMPKLNNIDEVNEITKKYNFKLNI